MVAVYTTVFRKRLLEVVQNFKILQIFTVVHNAEKESSAIIMAVLYTSIGTVNPNFRCSF
jgi:hypothetical protein